MDGRHDFDFLHGRWTVQNSRLARRLADNHDWVEFPATAECWPTLGGLGNVDRFVVPRFPDGKPLEGMSVRVFDPARRLWSIWWADDRRFVLDPPISGRYQGARGVFVGDDNCDGRPVRCRFIWTIESPALARWEQAFSADGEKTWETNWRMVLTRA